MAVIEAKRKYFSKDYINEVLPPLFKKQSGDCDFSESLLQIDSKIIKEEISKSSLTLLIATDQLRNQQLIQALKEKADLGIRIYLMLGDENNNKLAIDTLSGRCLVRTGVSQKGALLIRDHSTNNAEGVLVMNHKLFTNSEEQSWAIKLDTLQIEDSFRSFCKLFWESSQNEYLLQNQAKPQTTHPDGNIVTNHSHQLNGTLMGCLSDTLKDLQGASRADFGATGNEHLLLLETNSPNIEARQGMALSDTTIPTLLLSEQGDWLLPDSTDFNASNWCLRLSAQQSEQLAITYENAINDASWQYKSTIRLDEFADQETLRFAEEPSVIQEVKSHRCKELQPISTQSIDSFFTDEVELLAQPQIGWQGDFLAHQIDYNVLIHPPYCPQNATLDAVYAEWNKTEQDWQERLSNLEEQQQRIDKEQANIADKFKDLLKGFLLGQGQKVKKLNQELQILKQWSVTQASPAEREQNRKRLEALNDSVFSRGQNTAIEVDKAKQNSLWEEKRQQLEKTNEVAKSVLKDKRSMFESLSSQKSQHQLESKTMFIARWTNAVEQLSEGQLQQVKIHKLERNQFLPETMPEDENEQQAFRQQANTEFSSAIKSALLAMDYEEASEWRHSIKDKIPKKHYKEMNRAFDDYQQALNKIERDLEDANNEVDKAKVSQVNAEQALQKHGLKFEYKENNTDRSFDKQLGLKSSRTAKVQFDWPKEDLPTVGSELKADGKQRWLVIHDTEQLEQARKDAERLNAIICVNNPAQLGRDYA